MAKIFLGTQTIVSNQRFELLLIEQANRPEGLNRATVVAWGRKSDNLSGDTLSVWDWAITRETLVTPEGDERELLWIDVIQGSQGAPELRQAIDRLTAGRTVSRLSRAVPPGDPMAIRRAEFAQRLAAGKPRHCSKCGAEERPEELGRFCGVVVNPDAFTWEGGEYVEWFITCQGRFE